MPRKYLIVLFFLAFAPPLAWQGLSLLSDTVFAQTPQTECPPECVTDSMEIVTWYPSPYNEYEELRLYPKFSADESDCNSGDKLGLMYYNKDEQALKICWQDPSDLSYSWEKIGSEQSGLSRLGNYATSDIPSCSSAILGSLVYDTTEKRPYVCALNSGNSPVWKPLDSDYDKDGITDAVDANDNDFNDATATEANVKSGETFYARGSRMTGTLVSSDIGGVCAVVRYSPGGWCDHNGVRYWENAYNENYQPFGNAFLNTAAKFGCGTWHTAESVCGCPNGYTLTWLYDFDPKGYASARGLVYYCKKN